jgi:phosphotransacetylase
MAEKMDKITSANGIIERAQALGSEFGPFRVAVAAAEDDDVLRACSEAAKLGIAKFTLFGAEKKLKEIGEANGIDFSGFTIVDCDSANKSAHLASQAADKGEADLIQKGFLSTSALLKTVLSKDFSLRTENTLSHVAVLGIPGYHKLLGLTDGGMVVRPDFEQKIQLIENAVSLFHTLGYEKPKVAVSAPVDYIIPKISATTEAAQLTAMSKNGELKDCEVFGPITFEAATSRDIAMKRGIKNYVAGDADIFLVDSIEECNIISKVMILFSPAAFAGVIIGAKVPVSLVSRTDTAFNKLASISVACLLSHHLKRKKP